MIHGLVTLIVRAYYQHKYNSKLIYLRKNATQTYLLLVQTAMPNSGGRWMPGPYPNMAGNYPSGVNMGPGNIPKNYPMMYPPGNMMPQVTFRSF